MLVVGDAALIPLPDKSIHCIMTSPPYWGLRKYAGDQGDDPLGLEATPERHIERTVLWAREVRRVLRDDGVFWLNYGDCYAAHGRYDAKYESSNPNRGAPSALNSEKYGEDRPGYRGVQSGNLMLMPHRVAIALQEDGWIVRQDLIWYKRNPMPESVAGWRWERSKKIVKDETRGATDYKNNAYFPPQRDHHGDSPTGFAQPEYEYGDDYVLRKSSWRHTRAHEYVFMLVKDMQYYCNQEVVREELAPETNDRYKYEFSPVWTENKDNADPAGGGYRGDSTFSRPSAGRNPRSVLDVPTASYKGAHYATFPPNLIAPLIRASVPRRCCSVCGQAWAPVVNKTMIDAGSWSDEAGKKRADAPGAKVSPSSIFRTGEIAQKNVVDYRPTCNCGCEESVPGIVLDPFAGTGTTGMVAKELGRRWIAMDISMPYLDDQARYRTKWGVQKTKVDDLPLFSGLENA
jgi:DNA modification methylase